MIGKIIQPELEAFIASRDFSGLQAVFKEMLVPDIAEVIEDIKPTDRAVLFRLLPKQIALETFEYLDGTAQRELLAELGKAEVVSLLDEMHPDDRTALLEDLPGTIARDLIGSLSPDERRVAQALLGYPENSIGRLMTPEYLAVRPETTIAAVMENLRKHGRDSETFDVIYIVNTKGVLLDDVRLRELLLAPPEVSIGSIADGIVVSLNVTEDREASIQMFQRYGRTALPVVDKEGVLIGIVTVDDALAVAQEEHTEDIHKFGGLEAVETPYAATPLLTLVWKRAGWLVVLFLGEMLTATAMGYFENEIARAVVLALFVPLIISSGGNSGSQAATLIIRAMALEEIRLADWWRVMRRELLSGLILGLILGSIGFLRIAVWSAFSPIYGEHWLLVGLTVSGSLVGVVMWGTLSGSMLPFLLRALGADPAASSAPFVATLVDVTGLVIYFSVASFILAGTLL
ncbi:MAG: magnesium transporter [Ignavibacteriae bacterium]|nr:magnesium transporter [Ignavibacteriota bacterium]